MNFNKIAFIVLLVILVLMICQVVEAKRNKTYDNNRNSTKWKEYKKKQNLTILRDDLDKKA